MTWAIAPTKFNKLFYFTWTIKKISNDIKRTKKLEKDHNNMIKKSLEVQKWIKIISLR
jgi:hypothetical protein